MVPTFRRKLLRRGLIGVVGLLLVIQFVPVGRTNPAVVGEVQAPERVMAVLRQSCYDCHSNETVWPWYSRVAPMSWFVADHVHEGREHLNFSAWSRMNPGERAEAREEVWEEVAEGEMPLASYLWLHGDARLDEGDRAALRAWAGAGEGDRND